MKISIRSVGKEAITLEVESSDTVADVKKMIEEKKGIVAGVQSLSFAGKLCF